jgi:hypothetical protein
MSLSKGRNFAKAFLCMWGNSVETVKTHPVYLSDFRAFYQGLFKEITFYQEKGPIIRDILTKHLEKM